MTGSLYNLTWAEFGTSLVSAVQLLRCHDELVDCTLAAGGRTFPAHKVVLCAASPLLLDLLKNTTCKHPVILLAGVQASDLEALLEFVYRGEVSVEQGQLPSLLQAAHYLNIQGLAPVSHYPHETRHHSSPQSASDDSSKTANSSINQPHQNSEEDAIDRKRKRLKRPQKSSSPNSIVKWPKVHYGSENSNSGLQHENSGHSWGQHMNLPNTSSSPSTSIDGLPPSLVQNLATGLSNSNTSSSSYIPKMRGASDQPGACPLCGAMLRQARNLRRHLLTSCKYRMANALNNMHPTPPSTPLSSDPQRPQESQLHHLQPLVVHNVDQVPQSSTNSIDSKENLTPMTCSELLTS